MPAASKVKMGGSEKQGNRNKTKRVTGKFHVVVTQKNVCCTCNFFFANYTIFVVVFYRSRCLTVSVALHDFFIL